MNLANQLTEIHPRLTKHPANSFRLKLDWDNFATIGLYFSRATWHDKLKLWQATP